MKKLIVALTAIAVFGLTSLSLQASPTEDLEAFKGYFYKKFPDTAKDDFINGVYSIDKPSREQWEEMEEFPPYELDVDNGKDMWEKPFANGKTYASCLGEDVSAIRGQFPRHNAKTDTLETLESQINACRTANDEKPLKWKKGKLATLSAYIAFEGRDKIIDIKVEGEKAEAWYNKGKQFFYAKRGQLNMSCADCHINNAGNKIRADLLGPALGQPSHFPVYRSKWGGLGTLNRRYAGCNKQVRAKPFKAQSDEYKALEYFHTYMSNGLKWNGPGSRK